MWWLRPLLISCLVGVFACPRPGVVPPAAGGVSAGQAVQLGPRITRVTPSGAPAPVYGAIEEALPLTDSFEAAIAAEVVELARANRLTPPRWDERLMRTARDLAALVPTQEPLAYRAIEFVLHHHGIAEPTPHLLVIFSNRADASELAAAMRERITRLLLGGNYRHAGVGVVPRDDGQRAVILALQESHLELTPVAKVFAAGKSVTVRGRLAPPYRAPAMAVTWESGEVSSHPVRAANGGRFEVSLRCPEQPARMRLELTADSPQGNTVLANFPVYCAVEPPRELVLEQGVTIGAGDVPAAEAELVALINQARRRAGLPALQVDEAVAAVARRFSEEMARTGQVAHVSAESGSAADRLRRAGVVRALVQENLARAASVAEAHDSLMNSPGHRANTLSPDVTHVGVGVVPGRDPEANDILVTELYVRLPPAADVVATARGIGDRLQRGLKLQWDAELAETAAAAATELARARQANAARLTESGLLGRAAKRFLGVRAMVVAVADPAQVTAAQLGGVKGITHLGVGVAQADHPELGPGALYVVALLGRLR